MRLYARVYFFDMYRKHYILLCGLKSVLLSYKRFHSIMLSCNHIPSFKLTVCFGSGLIYTCRWYIKEIFLILRKLYVCPTKLPIDNFKRIWTCLFVLQCLSRVHCFIKVLERLNRVPRTYIKVELHKVSVRKTTYLNYIVVEYVTHQQNYTLLKLYTVESVVLLLIFVMVF